MEVCQSTYYAYNLASDQIVTNKSKICSTNTSPIIINIIRSTAFLLALAILINSAIGTTNTIQIIGILRATNTIHNIMIDWTTNIAFKIWTITNSINFIVIVITFSFTFAILINPAYGTTNAIQIIFTIWTYWIEKKDVSQLGFFYLFVLQYGSKSYLKRVL